MNIRKKFIVFSILCGIIPAIISTSICVSSFNARNIEMIRQNVETFTQDQAIYLGTFFDENISNLNSDANILEIKNFLVDSNNNVVSESKESIQMLNEILGNNKSKRFFLSRELVVNKSDIIIASGDNKYIYKKIVLSNEEMKELINSGAVVTDIIERDDFNNGIKSMIIAKAIFDKDEYQGFIANVINMNYFEKLVNDIRFFETGKIAIMDKTGVVAASSSKDLIKNINDISSDNNLYERWEKIDFDKNPNGVIEYKMKGIDKIGYYSRISGTGWVVLSGIELAEFKNPVDKSIKNVMIFLILISLIIITSYIFIINHFSKPIYELLKVIRKIKQGNFKDRFMYKEDNEFGEIATAFNDLIDTIEKNKKYIEEKNRDLQSLTSNIPGGVYTCKVEENEFILRFASSGYLKLLGYEKHEFKEIFDKKLIDLIYEVDRERIISEIKEQLEKSNKYNVEYRVKRRDGNIVWLLDNGQIIKNRDGNPLSYSVVINTTEDKTNQEELRLSEERYRIIMSQTEDAIFEWNIQKDIVYFSENWKNKFGHELIINNISENIYKTDYIYKDDIRKLGKMLNHVIYGEEYEEAEIRIKKNTSEYIWCKIRITAIFDENGDIFKAIGIIIDIDKEKKEAEKLLFKAQRDSLTSLYNKGTTESMIEEYIADEKEIVNGALFVIDLDNFKAVNDNLGHLAGDYVLTSISSMFLKVFEENSIIGRIGGDEFVIFLKNAVSEELICDKAEELIKGFKNSLDEEFSSYKVSGSIGIAKYPEHGNSFEELFINADKAAYLAKSRGKDNYCIFENI